MTDATPPTFDARDPFFHIPAASEWNACIGPQGDEENYADGYMEAAVRLAQMVIKERLYGSRDTLVLPILYTARHALELTLKYTVRLLHEGSMLRTTYRQNHELSDAVFGD